MKSAHLILCFLLCWGGISVSAQQDCGTDLTCFLKAVKRGKAANFSHRDAFFFVPLAEAIEQQWAVDKGGNFSIQLEGGDFVYRFLEQALKRQRYQNDKRWKDYVEEAKMEQRPIRLQIQCDCNASKKITEQLRAWTLGSYSFLDLERNQCVLQLLDKNIVPETYADDLHYELVGMSLIALKGDSKPKYKQRAASSKLEIDVSSKANKQFRLIPELSTIEYFKTEDDTPLTRFDALIREQQFPYLSFTHKKERRYGNFKSETIEEEPCIKRVSIKGGKVPQEGQHSILAKGRLVFSYPEGNTAIYKDTIFRDVKAKTYREMAVGLRTVAEWSSHGSGAEIVLNNMDLKKDYWCTVNIYSLSGELLVQTTVPTNLIQTFPIPAEGCIVEQIYQKGVLRYMPFSLNTSLSFRG